MSSEHPVLVHVAGPQKGHRVVLKYPLAVAGRASTAQILLKEEFVSRQHVKFEKTPDGCIVENLSSTGTLINGKKYKTGKKVILGTGDVLALGQQTKLLFVEPGSDIQEALDVYWQKNPGDRPLPMPDLPAEAPPLETPAAGAHPTPAIAAQPAVPLIVPEEQPIEPILVAEAPPTEEISPEDQEKVAQAAARKAKVRKYALLIGVYLVLIAGVVILLQSLRKDAPTGEARGMPLHLDSKAIGDILEKRVDQQPNVFTAQAALQQARSRYENRLLIAGDLYLCLKEFKKFLAYEPRHRFSVPLDEKKYRTVLDDLHKRIVECYEQAYVRERDRDWKKAQQLFEELMKIIPERDSRDPVYELVQNILDHEKYINPNLQRR